MARDVRQGRHGIHRRGSSDDEHDIRRRQGLRGQIHRLTIQRLAEPDHIGPQPGTTTASKRASSRCRPFILRDGATPCDAPDTPQVAVQLSDVTAACSCMQSVDVLSEQRNARTTRLPSRDRVMAGIRVRLGNRGAPPEIPFPDELRLPAKGLRSSQLFRPKLPPKPTGAAKNRYAALGGHPRSRQHHHTLGSAHPRRNAINHATPRMTFYTHRQMLRTLRVCVLIAVLLPLVACAEPPNKEMDQAQGAIDAARAAGAEQYATQEFADATDALKRSHDAVALRDYRLALSLAIDSLGRAQVAAKTAVENQAKARGDAERILAEANSALSQARTKLDAAALAKLPRRNATALREALAQAEKTMQEARAALAQDAYDRAITLAKSVSTQVQEILAAEAKQEPSPAPRRRR